MAADVQLRMLAPQLRDTAGRFRRADPNSALDKMILAWAEKAVAELREATPVEEGEPLQRWHPPPGTARASWRFDHVPSQLAVKITNEAPYLRFHVSGTGQDTGGYIYPNVAPMLVFYAKVGPYAGRKIWRPHVRGIEPNPQLVAAIDRLGPTARDMFIATGRDIIQRIVGLDGGS
jgi:hypothetical protein